MVDAVPHTAASTLTPCGAGAAPDPVTGLPPNCWPAVWPTDGRDGGVPDPTTAGPKMVQIGTEGGVLPNPVVIPSTPTGYEYNRRSITVLNIFTHGLLLGPAERADVIVDFSDPRWAGKTLILYNDAPAPVPAFDPRTDYYTGSADQSPTGGAPATMPGYGPNTRTLLQIKVSGTSSGRAFNLSALQASLPGIFAATQEPIIVPETAYPAANGGSTQDNYVRIDATSVSMFKNSPVSGLTLTSPGANYTSIPTVAIASPTGCILGTLGCALATATATIGASVGNVTLGASGAGYTTPPTVNFAGGGGFGAAATAVLTPRSLAGITLTNAGSGYSSAPTVTIAPPAAWAA